ncbi:MAG: hypothetical protein ABIP48_21155 [Planctomycetota bacterium]
MSIEVDRFFSTSTNTASKKREELETFCRLAGNPTATGPRWAACCRKEKTMEDKERADLFLALANRATERFESYRRLEWRTLLALWATFGVGAGVVISADAWNPCAWEAVVAVVVVVVAIYGCWRHWLPYLSSSIRRTNWLSYYWETHVERILGPERPKILQPPPDNDTWPSAFDTDPNNVLGKAEGENRELPSTWHRAQWIQLSVTILFGCLFVFALASKAYHASETQGAPSKMTIEGGSLEINNGTSKLKLGE